MILVQKILVEKDVTTANFACDLAQCRGACCTMPGGSGAPLEEEEVKHVQNAEKHALPWLSKQKQAIINNQGSVEGTKGDRTTRCVEDQDCVFVYYENNVAKCAIERAWLEGKSEFRKPLSCHLFPIRVDDLFGGARLRYERIDQCKPGRERGKTEGIDLIEFLKEPIIRAFGESFYKDLKEQSE